ncbi:MAG: hypothetical protein RR342_01420 [Bacilli bacterium]
MREIKRILNGSKEYICERICTTYIETGRTMKSLAGLYRCSKTSIHRYLTTYARECVSYDLYKQVQSRIRQNLEERNNFGRSGNCYNDSYGSMD